MKKLILSVCVICGLMSAANAQKIGYVSGEELMSAMPEYDKAQKDLTEYGEVLVLQKQELEQRVVELDSLLTKTDTIKPGKAKLALLKKEFGEKYVEYQQFDQKAQQEIEQKRASLLEPVRNKALETIKTVAKEAGYTYVLDKSVLIVSPPGDDILGLCKKKLGIVDKPKAAGPATR
jgi:outer membrane protein